MDVKQRGDLATFSNLPQTRSPRRVAKRSAPSKRAVGTATEQRMLVLCLRRASAWADAVREGLDPDIARFMRDQAVAWQFLATSFASSARHTPYAG
jgi:hypothetical protein